MCRIITYHFEERCPFSKGMLHLLKDSSINCRGIACWKKTLNLLKGKLQKNDKCFSASRRGFIVAFNFLFRTWMQYIKFMLHENQHFWETICDILQGIVERFMQLYQWYYGANIYFDIFIPELCVFRMIPCSYWMQHHSQGDS